MFKPFADDRSSDQIGDLTLENQLDRVVIYGNTELTRDQVGLAQAKQLKQLMEAIIETLEATDALPKALPKASPAETVDNPFK